MMKRMAMAGAAILITTGAAFAQDAGGELNELKVGDKAPALKDVKWVKGEAVDKYRSGDIYILDFWATWCGPCIAAIPHMNEIAKKYKDDGVHIIGVAISDQLPKVEAFVEEKGDAMSYLIAYDDEKRKTASVYMDGTMSRGIPTVMIINREGTLSWVGHPMNGMDDALEAIVEGTFDLEAAKLADEKRRSSLREQAMLQQKLKPIMDKVGEAMLDNDYKTAIALLDEAIALSPEMLAHYHINKYNIAVGDMKDPAVAKRIAGQIEASPLMDNPNALNAVAWAIVDPARPTPDELRDLAFAQRLAEKADKMTDHNNPAIIDTVARVWFAKGDVNQAIMFQKKAIAAQQAAIDAADPAQAQMMEAMKSSLEDTLKEYESAASAS